ncbi:hypothetical protein JAAARDRAFT_32037 [Jaapia argillacea MUCL 33604]|uniref:Major facilitator superfamily (MFS) profile domain-containing protein n=1 Tax=Jaapia argillacea MUCL 33604 TaxID=933084 RepID=A0A067QEK3_9AGAM|nr:hypothetical protein JAAARDRAFT_32037 [Jaapia argillacea MUCL 33604]
MATPGRLAVPLSNVSRDNSRSRSASRRPVGTRHASAQSIPYLPDGPADLLLPEGQVGEEAAELLHEFIHPHHHPVEETLPEDGPPPGDDGPLGSSDQAELEVRKNLPWWKRPSPYWFITTVPFTAITTAGTMAPKIELYTQLACKVHRPEYSTDHGAGVFVPTSLSHSSSSPSSWLTGPPSWSTLDPFWNAQTGDMDDVVSVSFIQPTNGTDTPRDDKNLCATDPVVQAAVAELNAVFTTTMGILGFTTTAYWGSLSDRYGRTFVLKLTSFGLLFQAVNFVLVAWYSEWLPGGYWWVLLGGIVEGFSGGITTAAAAVHAYMADCCEPGTRSRVFSLQLGLLFLGMALGPTLASLLIKYTQNLLSIFYLTLVIDVCYVIFIWGVVPESLTRGRMEGSRQKYDDLVKGGSNREGEDGQVVSVWERVVGRGKSLRVFSPLSILVPPKMEGKGRKRDWNLTLAVASLGLVFSIIGSFTYKFQYASATFGWTSEELGYWLSLVGAARAIHLTVVLPVLISFFKPKPPPIALPTSPSEPLHSSPSRSPSPPTKPPTPTHLNSPAFDLTIARISLIVDIIAYTLMPLAPSPTLFTLAAILGSFGAGFGPAVQSLSLELFLRREDGGGESGRLFGAISVVQVMCSQVLSPAIFGLVYMKTVATFPKAIFFMSAGVVVFAFVLFSLIRLPKESEDGRFLEGEEEGGEGGMCGGEESAVESAVEERGGERRRKVGGLVEDV